MTKHKKRPGRTKPSVRKARALVRKKPVMTAKAASKRYAKAVSKPAPSFEGRQAMVPGVEPRPELPLLSSTWSRGGTDRSVTPIQFKVTSAERAHLVQCAKDAGVSLSKFVRDAALGKVPPRRAS